MRRLPAWATCEAGAGRSARRYRRRRAMVIDRVRLAHRRAVLRRGQVVYAATPLPVWVPEPMEPSSRLTRVLARTSAGRVGRLQPVAEAALRTVSDGSAVLSVLGR